MVTFNLDVTFARYIGSRMFFVSLNQLCEAGQPRRTAAVAVAVTLIQSGSRAVSFALYSQLDTRAIG